MIDQKTKIAGLPPGGPTRSALLNILTDLKEAQRNLDRERKRNKAILGTLAYGILIFNKSEVLVFVNRKAEDFLDLRAEDVMGKSIAELLSEPKPALKALVKELSLNSSDITRKDVVIGDSLTVEMIKSGLRIDGESQGFVVSLYDVTRERLIERLKTEFVSLAAHQLRTPLSGVKWAIELILGGEVGKISKEQRELLRKSYDGNERMIRLINQLLELTRLEAGKYVQNPVTISLESLVEPVVNSMRPEAEGGGLELGFVKSKEKLPRVRVDAEKMRLVIENLIRNAIQYTPQKGKVTVFVRYAKKGVECVVSDTGIGIPASHQNRVFDRFFRAKNAVRLDTEGSGLGLYLSKNIVEAHGGRISFESQEGKGSTFYIWLPEAK